MYGIKAPVLPSFIPDMNTAKFVLSSIPFTVDTFGRSKTVAPSGGRSSNGELSSSPGESVCECVFIGGTLDSAVSGRLSNSIEATGGGIVMIAVAIFFPSLIP